MMNLEKKGYYSATLAKVTNSITSEAILAL